MSGFGKQLFNDMRKLHEKGEPFCVKIKGKEDEIWFQPIEKPAKEE